MPNLSQRSKERLATCHPWIQDVVNEAIKVFDFTVTCGHRNKKEQMIAFQEGKSLLEYPKSKHNKSPSLAIDLHPYPIDFKNLMRYAIMAGIIKYIAFQKKIPIKWGGDFNSLKDFGHFEINKGGKNENL